MDTGNKSQSGNMYCQGAIKNMELAEQIYPGWRFRFYIDNSVPDEIVNRLVIMGAEIINVTNIEIPESNGNKYPGMFWRFLPMNDTNIDVFIVRDVDSRINEREALAVEEWLNSGKQLHIMRDHPHHFYKILGGMWGFNCKMGRYNFPKSINSFLKIRNYNFKRMDDMLFLDSLFDDCLNKNSVFQHDTFFKKKWGDSVSFPKCIYDIDQSFYRYVGEIFDEYTNAVNEVRDKELFNNQNYKKIMSNRIGLFK
jgi:hypothetical protein